MKLKLLLFSTIFFGFQQLSGQSFIIPAEFEKNEGVILTWDYNSSVDSTVSMIASGLQDAGKVFIIYYPGTVPYDTNYIKSLMATYGVVSGNITFIPAWTETLWIRDYGPFTAYEYTGNRYQRLFLDARYSDYNRPKDDSIPVQLATNIFQIPYYHIPLDFEGGNIIFDGLGRGFGSKRILDQNPSFSETQVADTLRYYFGLYDFVFLEKLENSGGGIWSHVDMYMKMIDNETFIIAEYPDSLPDYNTIEKNVQTILNLTNMLGRSYKVHRLPAPVKDDGTYASTQHDEMRTYTNSIMINDVVVIPSYNLPSDLVAKQIYKDLLPGYQIKMVDARSLTPNYGAIHCITRQIPPNDMMRIKHAKYQGGIAYQPTINLVCHAQCNQPVDSLFLLYRIHPDTLYQKMSFNFSCPNSYTDISNLSMSDTVSYFIQAKTYDNKELNLPIPGKKGPYTFWFDPNAEIHEGICENKRFRVFPNPASEYFILHNPYFTEECFIEIYTISGQHIYSDAFTGNTFQLSLREDFKPGQYIIRFTNDQKTQAVKVAIY